MSSKKLEYLKLNLKGRAFITNGSEEIHINNTIQDLATEIIGRLLIGSTIHKPSLIRIINDGIGLYDAPITIRNIIPGVLTTIELSAICDATSFSGDVDKLELHCDSFGAFSEIDAGSGIIFNKPNGTTTTITWIIEISL